MMCSRYYPSFWLKIDEEDADLPYVARLVLKEVKAHLDKQEDGFAEEHLEDLTHFSAQIEDHLVQAKIRLEIAQVAANMQRLDIARPAIDYVIHLLDGNGARQRHPDAMLLPIQYHYLAKSYLLLADLESQEGKDHGLILTYLQKGLDKLTTLGAYQSDHLLASGETYKDWMAQLCQAIEHYVHEERLNLWASQPVENPDDSAGNPAQSEKSETQEQQSSGRQPDGAAQPTASAQEPGYHSEPSILQTNGIGELALLGEIAIGKYREIDGLQESWGHVSTPDIGPEPELIALDQPYASKFIIEGIQHNLYGLKPGGQSISLKTPAREYYLLRIAPESLSHRDLIVPGDYVLVHYQETARFEDLVVFWRKVKTIDFAKLDEYCGDKPPARVHPAGRTNNLEDEADNPDAKITQTIRGVVLGVFKRVL